MGGECFRITAGDQTRIFDGLQLRSGEQTIHQDRRESGVFGRGNRQCRKAAPIDKYALHIRRFAVKHDCGLRFFPQNIDAVTLSD